MSRYPVGNSEEQEKELIKIDDTVVKTSCGSIHTPHIETVSAPLNITEILETQGHTLAQIEIRELRKHQREDRIIGKWVRAVTDKKMPDRTVLFVKDDHIMKKNFSHFHMIRGVLYRTIKEGLVLPELYR